MSALGFSSSGRISSAGPKPNFVFTGISLQKLRNFGFGGGRGPKPGPRFPAQCTKAFAFNMSRRLSIRGMNASRLSHVCNVLPMMDRGRAYMHTWHGPLSIICQCLVLITTETHGGPESTCCVAKGRIRLSPKNQERSTRLCSTQHSVRGHLPSTHPLGSHPFQSAPYPTNPTTRKTCNNLRQLFEGAQCRARVPRNAAKDEKCREWHEAGWYRYT